jgi:hypothetical protein
LENAPSIAMKKKYYHYNIGVFILLLAIFAFDSIIMAIFFFPEWFHAPVLQYSYFERYVILIADAINMTADIALLIGVGLYKMETYSWIAVRAVLSLLQIVAVNVSSHHDTDGLVYLTFGLLVISFFAGLFMSIKLSPRRVPKIIDVVVDENEKIKKTIYVFPD